MTERDAVRPRVGAVRHLDAALAGAAARDRPVADREGRDQS